MGTFKDFSAKFAEKMAKAVQREKLAGGLLPHLKTASRSFGHVLEAANEIDSELESLVYTETDRPLSESDKERILDDAAKTIGVSGPVFRRMVKGGSIDNGLRVVREIEEIINSAKPPKKN